MKRKPQVEKIKEAVKKGTLFGEHGEIGAGEEVGG